MGAPIVPLIPSDETLNPKDIAYLIGIFHEYHFQTYCSFSNLCNSRNCQSNYCWLPYLGDALFQLSSNHLIHGGQQLARHLGTLFSAMIVHGYTPNGMNLSTLVPIPKSQKKSVNDSSNYRAIALGSLFGKVLDNIIISKCRSKLCTSELQFGFKPKSSTTQCTFVLNEIVDLYERNGSPIHLVLLDATQAFDRIEYCKLFKVLLERNVCNVIVRQFLLYLAVYPLFFSSLCFF